MYPVFGTDIMHFGSSLILQKGKFTKYLFQWYTASPNVRSKDNNSWFGNPK